MTSHLTQNKIIRKSKSRLEKVLQSVILAASTTSPKNVPTPSITRSHSDDNLSMII